MKITLSSGRRSGRFTRKLSVTTNDPEHRKESLVCVATVKVPFSMEPKALSFGRVERDAESKQKTIKITRGDGSPLALELSPVQHPNVRASLREIEAGEHYELDVEIVPPWPNTPLRTNLKLKTGVSEAPEETIRVYAQIAPRLRATPTRFTIPRTVESELELTARLLWSGGNPGKILEASSSDPETSVRVEERDGQQLVIMSVPAGYTPQPGGRAAVTVKTDDPEAPTLRISVYAARSPRVVRPTPAIKRVTLTPKGSEKEETKGASRPPSEPVPKKPKP